MTSSRIVPITLIIQVIMNNHIMVESFEETSSAEMGLTIGYPAEWETKTDASEDGVVTMSIASSATTVLPEPTSPCSRRSMGCACARSPSISPIERLCAPVRPNGSCSLARSDPSPRNGWPRRLRLFSFRPFFFLSDIIQILHMIAQYVICNHIIFIFIR